MTQLLVSARLLSGFSARNSVHTESAGAAILDLQVDTNRPQSGAQAVESNHSTEKLRDGRQR